LQGPVVQSALVLHWTHPEAALQAPVGDVQVSGVPATQPVAASQVLAGV
jgi:hypothetical protein